MELENIISNSGPGTGKTENMITTIRNMLKAGYKTDQILGFTFTTAAARNMKERLAEFEGLRIYNIHQYCNQLTSGLSLIPQDLLAYFVKQLSIAPRYRGDAEAIPVSIINTHLDKWRIFNFLRNENKTYNDYKRCVTTEENVDDYIKYCDLSTEADINHMRSILEKVRTILNRLFELDYIDFFDMVVYGYYNIEEPDIKYIIVDEFQDLTYVEYKFITTISKQAKYMFLCDTNQGIYKWRHSDMPFNLKHFKTFIGDLKENNLSINYRCSQEVLKLSNALTKKDDKPNSELPGKVTIMCDYEEPLGYITNIARNYDGVNNKKKLAILTQSNVMAGTITNELKTNKIKAYNKVKNSTSEVPAIRLLLKITSVLHHPYNSYYLKNLLLDDFFVDTYNQDKLSLARHLARHKISSDVLMYEGESPVLYHQENAQYVIFDTEATGLDYDHEDIIQIAAIKLNANLEEIDRMNIYLKTEKDISESEKVHHITKEYLEEHGIDRREGLLKALEFFQGCILIAHNTAFDSSILQTNLSRLKIKHNLANYHWMDTLDLARIYLHDLKPQNYKLGTLVEMLNLDATPNHNAMFDVEATVLLFKYILNKTNTEIDQVSIHPALKTYYDQVMDFIHHLDYNTFSELIDAVHDAVQELYKFSDKDIVFYESFRFQIDRLIERGFSVSSILDFFEMKHDLIEDSNINITVCTIHQSKGLEFDDVIMVQEFRSSFKDGSDANNAENVAVSRAINTFTLITSLDKRYSRIASEYDKCK